MDREPSTRRFAAALVVFAAVGVLVAGCAGDDPSSGAGDIPYSGTAPSDSPTPTAGAPGGSGKAVTVDETEYKLALSRSTFPPGRYTFTVANRGEVTHALDIEGPGMKEAESDTLAPGASTSLTVTLRKGSYILYCPVGGHRALGMETKITVG